MRWLIFALGVALALGGAASIVSGVPYIRMEFGWTEVLAGTTALSAGIMTVALGAVLGALRRIEARFVSDTAIRTADPMSTFAVPTDQVSDVSEYAGHEPEVPVPSALERDIPPSPASRPLAERIWSKPSTVVASRHERAEASVPVEPSRSPDRSPGVRTAGSAAALDRDSRRQYDSRQLDVAAPRSYGRPAAASPTRGDTDDRVPSLIPSPQPPVTGEAAPEAPTVVGRYESGGASYVLFSDGTIEVETEVGLHRFGSMEELKAYIDQQQTSATS